MAVELGTGFVSITASAKGIQKSIADELRGSDKLAGAAGQEAGGKFGSEFAAGAGGGGKVEGASRELGTKLAKGLAIGGAAIAAFSIHAAHSFTDATDAVKKFQRVAGGSFEDSSRLVFLFKRLSIDPAAATSAIAKLSRGITSGKVDLEKYGVSVQKNADGSINMRKAVVDLAGAFSKLNAGDRQQAIFDTFGRSGNLLLPILTKTKSELNGIFDLAAKDHQVFGKQDIQAADSYKKSLAELNAAWGGLQAELGKAVIPILKGVTSTLTPLAQALADNAGALTTFGEVAGGPVLAAVAALFVVQKGLDFAPAARKIADFAKGLKTAGAAAEGLKGSLAGLGLAGLIVGGLLALGKAIGYFDDQQTKAERNAPKFAQAVVAASLKSTGGLGDARARFAQLGAEIARTDKLQSAVAHSTSQGAQVWSKYGKTIQDVFDRSAALSSRLGGLRAEHEKLGHVIDLTANSQGKQVKTTEASRAIASALSATIVDIAAKSQTYAAAQDRLAQATARASAASSDDKTAKKELQDAINDVANAQERMNNAVLASVDATLGAQAAEQTLTQAIKDHADSLTLAQDASALAKAKVEEWNQALQLAGKGPLDAKQSTSIYRQALVDLATQYPATAASVLPLIAQIDAANKVINETPTDKTTTFHANTGDASAAVSALQGQINLIKDKTVKVAVETFFGTTIGPKNLDGSPDRDGNPFNSRAAGGPVSAGKLYRVNERGEEFFIPSMNGRILSHEDSLARLAPLAAGTGGGDTIFINIPSLMADGASVRRAAVALDKHRRNGGSSGRN